MLSVITANTRPEATAVVVDKVWGFYMVAAAPTLPTLAAVHSVRIRAFIKGVELVSYEINA